MFTPNPDFEGDITPFQHGIMREYMAEYNLEKGREFHNFKSYPSRLNAIYLFDSEEEANKYKVRHTNHVDGRILKKATLFVHLCRHVKMGPLQPAHSAENGLGWKVR